MVANVNPEKAIARKRPAIRRSEQVDVFRRDHWLCHWCRRPVIFPPALALLAELVKPKTPAYFHHNWRRDLSPLLDELGAVIDHRQTHARDGHHGATNFVTACAKCNMRKSAEPAEVWHPAMALHTVKGKGGEPTTWDGLTAVFLALADPAKLSQADRGWYRALRELTTGG